MGMEYINVAIYLRHVYCIVQLKIPNRLDRTRLGRENSNYGEQGSPLVIPSTLWQRISPVPLALVTLTLISSGGNRCDFRIRCAYYRESLWYIHLQVKLQVLERHVRNDRYTTNLLLSARTAGNQSINS